MSHIPQNILVTGGAGFIGSNLVRYWLEKCPDQRVVVLDALTYVGIVQTPPRSSRIPNFDLSIGDILDTALVEQLLKEEQINTIAHFAAESHVDRSIHGHDAFLKTNIEGTHS